MPTYEYECAACGHEFEAMQSISGDRLKKCPQCGKLKLQRIIGTGSGIIFKGSGFYATDYKKKSSSSGDSKDKPETKPSQPAAKPSNGCSPNCGCGHA